MEKRVVFQQRWLPALLLLPQLTITVVFFFIPAGEALYQSLFRQDAFGLTVTFAGLENFKALFTDPHYLASFRTTAVFSLGVTFLGLTVALTLAYFADRLVRLSTAVRTLIIWPYAIAPAIAGVLWMFLFNPSLGLVSYRLKAMGVPWNYLLDGFQALLLVTVIAAWKQISYNFLFFLAGLQSDPQVPAGGRRHRRGAALKRFWSIVFPLLTPTTFFLLVVNMIYSFFETFAIVDAVTQGGPANATQILVYKVYQDGFKGLDIGGSAAQSVILMGIVIILTILQFRHVERRVNYEPAMVERNRLLDLITWAVLIAGIALVCLPIYFTLVASTLPPPRWWKCPCACCRAGTCWRTTGPSSPEAPARARCRWRACCSTACAWPWAWPAARSPCRSCRPSPSSTSASRSAGWPSG